MINRTFDANLVNSVVNDPSIYPWVHGSVVGPIDLGPVLANRDNYCLWGEHGGTVFIQMQPGLYELHTQVLPEGRGKWTISMVRASFEWMFTRTDCVEILTRCPQGNIAAKAAAKRVGMAFEFTRPNTWVQDHKPIPSDIYSLKVQDWMRDAPGLVEKGEKFHHDLVAEYTRMGSHNHSHPQDSNHDRYVGGAMEMVKGGQPMKAMVFYNRWARVSGYTEISILKAEPVIMDITEAILMIKGDELRVVSCRSD